MHLRPYDPDADRAALWRLKAAFERHLAAGTGGPAKAAAYEGKLTDDYRDRYLDWVDRCVAEQASAVVVAEGDEADAPGATAADGPPDAAGDEATGPPDDLVGYAFVLPESLAHIWDAGVLNELYVAPAHRGTGVADDLLVAALDAVRRQELPLDRLVLDVDPENARARGFYDRHGFEPWGELVARPL